MPVITPNIPEGLIELMKVFAKWVLKEKPDNIYEFSVVHFERLLYERDGDLNKGYERFAASEKYLEAREKCLMSQVTRRNKNGRPDPIKITPIEGSEDVTNLETLSPQSLHHKFRPRKLSSRKASEALLSIKEEDEGHNATEELVLRHGKLTAARRIQRAYKSYRKRKAEKENGAAFIIQRTFKKLFSRKLDKAIKNDRESTCSNIQNDSGVESDVPKDEVEGEDVNQKESNVPSFAEVESQRSTNLEFDNIEKPPVENLDEADSVVKKDEAVESENSDHVGSNIGSSPSKQVEVAQTHLNDQSGHVDTIAEIVPTIDANSQRDQNHTTGEIINADILKDIGEPVKTDAAEAGKSNLEREGRFASNDTNNIGSVVSDVHHDKGDDIEIVNKTNGFPKAILEEVTRNGSKNDISKETIELVKTPRESDDGERHLEENNNNSEKIDDNANIGNRFKNEEESHNLDNRNISGAEQEENEESASSLAGNKEISNDTEKDQSQLSLNETRSENDKGLPDNIHEGTGVQSVTNSEGKNKDVNNVSDHHIDGTDNGNEDNKDNNSSMKGADLAIPKSVWYVGSVPIITTKSIEGINESNSLEEIITENSGYNGNNGDQKKHDITIENNSETQGTEKEKNEADNEGIVANQNNENFVEDLRNEISEDIGNENNVAKEGATEPHDIKINGSKHTEDDEAHMNNNKPETTEGSIANPEKKGEIFEEADKIINKGKTIETESGKALEEELKISKDEGEETNNNNESNIAHEQSDDLNGSNNTVKTEKSVYNDKDPSDSNKEPASFDEAKNDKNSKYHNAISCNDVDEANVNGVVSNYDEENKGNSQKETIFENESKQFGENKPLLSTYDGINDPNDEKKNNDGFDGNNEAPNTLSEESDVNNEDENGINVNKTEVIEDDIKKVVLLTRYESPTKFSTTFAEENKPIEENKDSEISEDKIIAKELLRHASVKDTDIILKEGPLSEDQPAQNEKLNASNDQSVRNEEIDTSFLSNNQQIRIENKNYTEIYDAERKNDQSLLNSKELTSENKSTVSRSEDLVNHHLEHGIKHENGTTTTIKVTEVTNEDEEKAMELERPSSVKGNSTIEKKEAANGGIIEASELLNVEPNVHANEKELNTNASVDENLNKLTVTSDKILESHRSNLKGEKQQKQKEEIEIEGFILEPAFKDNDGGNTGINPEKDAVSEGSKKTTKAVMTNSEQEMNSTHGIEPVVEEVKISLPEDIRQKGEGEVVEANEMNENGTEVWDNKSAIQNEERKESDPSSKQRTKENQRDNSNGSVGNNNNTENEGDKLNIAVTLSADLNTTQKQEESMVEKQINLPKGEETNPEEILQDHENENNSESRGTVGQHLLFNSGKNTSESLSLGNVRINEDKTSSKANINEEHKQQENDSLQQELDNVNNNKKDAKENGNETEDDKENKRQNDNETDDNDQIENVSDEQIKTIEKTQAIPYEANLKNANRELKENKNVQSKEFNDVEGTKFGQETMEHTEVNENACESNEKCEQNADVNYRITNSGNKNKSTSGLEQTPKETKIGEELLKIAADLEQKPGEIVEEPLQTPKTISELQQPLEETKILHLEQTLNGSKIVEGSSKITKTTPDLEQMLEKIEIGEESFKLTKTTPALVKTESMEEPLKTTKATPDLEKSMEEPKFVKEHLKTSKTTSDLEKTETGEELLKTAEETPDLEKKLEETKIVEEPLKTIKTTLDLVQTTEKTKIVEEPGKTPKATAVLENTESVEEPLKTSKERPALEQTMEETKIVEEQLRTPKTTSDLEKTESVEEVLKITEETLDLEKKLEETKIVEEPLKTIKATPDVEKTIEKTKIVEEPPKTPKTTADLEKIESVEEPLITTKETPDLEQTMEETKIMEEPLKAIKTKPDLEQTMEKTKIVEKHLKTPNTTSDLEKTESVEEPLKTTKETPDLDQTMEETKILEEPLNTIKTTLDLKQAREENKILEQPLIIPKTTPGLEFKKNIEDKERNDNSKRVKERNENEDQTKYNKNINQLESTNDSSDTSQACTDNTINEKKENIELQENMEHIASIGNLKEAHNLEKASTEQKRTEQKPSNEEHNIGETVSKQSRSDLKRRCSKSEEFPTGGINTNLEGMKENRETSEIVSNSAGKHKSIREPDKDNMNIKEICENEELKKLISFDNEEVNLERQLNFSSDIVKEEVRDGKSENCKQDEEKDDKIVENRQNDSTVQLNKTYTISKNKSEETAGDNVIFKQQSSATLNQNQNTKSNETENDLHCQKSTEKLQVKEMEDAAREEPIMKHTSASEVQSAHLSEAETTRAESRSTINDELSEIENLDISTYGEDSLEAMYYSLRKNEIMLDRMQKRASERKSASKEREPFEKLDLRQVKSMSEMNRSMSVSSDDDVIIKRVERNNINQFISPISVAAQNTEKLLESMHQIQSSSVKPPSPKEEDRVVRPACRMYSPSIRMKSRIPTPIKDYPKSVSFETPIAVAQRKSQIFMQRLHDDSKSSETLDSLLNQTETSDTNRQKMLAYSVSEADSDNCEAAEKINVTHDDFNVSTALETASTETDSTIVSAATKIQAGARGFLTRRRLRRASEGALPQQSESKASFGNEAIGESLEDLVEQNAASKIQKSYRKYLGSKQYKSESSKPSPETSSSSKSSDGSKPVGITQVKIGQKRDHSDNDDDAKKADDIDDGYHGAYFEGLNLAERRMTLQRGDAVQKYSTPEEENGSLANGRQSGEAGDSKPNTSPKQRKPVNDTWRYFGLRQRTMPVQIETDILRVVPKHMRKRIKSADTHSKQRQVMQ